MTRLKSRRRSGFSLIELLVIVFILVLFFGAFVPACVERHGRNGESANRVKCASNLRQIGQAILLYSNENRGAYPRARATTGPIVVPVWGTAANAPKPFADDGPGPNDVTAAIFLLLRTQDITSEVFCCPNSNAEPDPVGRPTTQPALSHSNFTDFKKHLSYSYQNPYPNDGAVTRGWKLNNSISAEYAVAADINPGIKGTGQNVLAVTANSNAGQMKQANTANHDGDGQNVLYGDGHVEWQQNPFCGVNRDNVYTRSRGNAKEPDNDTSDPFGSPYDVNDSVLLPTDD